MTIRGRLLLLICALMLLCCAAVPSSAQEPMEIVRVRTRVVFLDALVKDKRTEAPVSDLKLENFAVFDDGKPRVISYFSREGEARRPLALTLVLDLSRLGAGRFLRRTEVLEAMIAELAKLPPEDEVAVLAVNPGGAWDRREWLTNFTRDRFRVAAALAVVPTLVAAGASDSQENTGAETQAETPAAPAPVEKNEERKEVIESETKTVNKDGKTIITTKKINAEGKRVTEVKTINKDGSGSTEIDVHGDFPLSVVTQEITKLVAKDRPKSQGVMVWVSDGINVIPYSDRDDTESILIRSNTIFSALIVDMKMGFKLFKPILKPLGNWVGLSIYGSSQHLAKQSGGDAVRVRRPMDYATGLRKIIGNLTARYNLGFSISEDEQDDGRLHQLEVRVKARDAKGKDRKLEVSARRGYYMPKSEQTAAATQ